jgi:hypothetical protein
VRHLKSRPPPRERLKVVCTMTVCEMNRPSDEARKEVIRYGAGVDCKERAEVSDGIL